METYKIIRFYFNGDPETRQTGLSLEEAQEWCNDPETREEGKWFDGYAQE